jgi:hypothetical protein
VTSALAPGAIARHRLYGIGTVRACIGETVRIFFPSIGQEKVVLADELGASAVASKAGRPPTIDVPPPPDGDFVGRRQLVECLRQGIPPTRNVSAWTVGFDDVRGRLGAAFDDAVRRRKGSAVVIEGPYGQGKSHVGRWARELALQRSVAVMEVDLDGAALSLTNPALLMARLLASIELPDGKGGALEPVGLGTLLREAGPRLAGVAPPALSHFAFFLQRWAAFEADEAAIEILERFLSGEIAAAHAQAALRSCLGAVHLILPTLRMNYGTRDDRLRARADQLSRILELAERCGARGVLVIIDELDHDRRGSHWKADKLRPALEMFAYLAQGGPFVTLFLATPGIVELDVGHSRRVQLPSLSLTELQQLFARAVGAYAAADAQLQLGSHLEELFGRTWDLYERGFRNLGWGPRFFVRAAIEACDVARARGVPVSEVTF